MAETIHPIHDAHLARIEPDERVVVHARTIEAPNPDAESTLKDSATDRFLEFVENNRFCRSLVALLAWKIVGRRTTR